MINVVSVFLCTPSGVWLNQRSDNVAYPQLWQNPGGKMEPNETAQSAIIREIQEECGIHLDPLRIVHLGDSPVLLDQQQREYQVHTYWILLLPQELPQLMEPSKQGPWRLIPYASLPSLCHTSVPSLPQWFDALSAIQTQLQKL